MPSSGEAKGEARGAGLRPPVSSRLQGFPQHWHELRESQEDWMEWKGKGHLQERAAGAAEPASLEERDTLGALRPMEEVRVLGSLHLEHQGPGTPAFFSFALHTP